MSSQKGNASRSRPQKYQNGFAFKNNLHDTSHRTKFINSLQVANVCERCKSKIEWKIRYKKYKPLKAPANCSKCHQKVVKFAYHITCQDCSKKFGVCPKCNEKKALVEPSSVSLEERLRMDAEMQAMIKSLPERKRRTFLRYMNGKVKGSTSKTKEEKKNHRQNGASLKDIDAKEQDFPESEADSYAETQEDLMKKLKSLIIANEDDLDGFSDFEDDGDGDDDDIVGDDDDGSCGGDDNDD